MLWLTTVNATINKGTKERLLGHLKKMLRFGLGKGVGGGGGDDKSGLPLEKSWRRRCVCSSEMEKNAGFCTRGLSNYSSHVSRVVVEDTPKVVRIRLDSVEELVEFQGNEWKLRFLGGDSVDRFQYTSTTELNCEP